MPNNRAGVIVQIALMKIHGVIGDAERARNWEPPRFFYVVELCPYLVRMDFVVSWARGVCRTSALQLLSAQRLIVPFKSHSPLPFCFVSTVSAPNGSPDKETHQNDHRKGIDSTLQTSLIWLGTRVRQTPHTETGAALGRAAPMHQRSQTVPRLHTGSLLHAATIVPRRLVERAHW
jgi:hypothetical protein